jgi:hypothetical protein
MSVKPALVSTAWMAGATGSSGTGLVLGDANRFAAHS